MVHTIYTMEKTWADFAVNPAFTRYSCSSIVYTFMLEYQSCSNVTVYIRVGALQEQGGAGLECLLVFGLHT